MLSQVLPVDSTHANAYINLAPTSINQGQSANAIRSYNFFLTLYGTSDTSRAKVLEQLDLLERANSSGR